MNDSGLPDDLWSHLDGRLWHATDRNGLRGIMADGEITAAFGNRYKGSFCRNQGGVCLFDFGPASEMLESQITNWHGWFGHQQDARVPVWLEIDRGSVRENLLDAKAAREGVDAIIEKRLTEGGVRGQGIQIIPGVEACHSGPVSLAAIVGVLLIDQHDFNLVRRIGRPDDNTIRQIAEFESTLPPFEEDPTVVALQKGRRRALEEPLEDDQE